MRKIFLSALSTILFATSCDTNDNNNFDFPDSYRFATVMSVEVEATTDTDEDANEDEDDTTVAEIYFLLDTKETFIVTENISRTDLQDLEIGERVIMGVTLTECVEDSYDYTAKLYEVVTVLVGDDATVTTEEESDSIADHKLAYVAKDMTLSHGYLNIFVGLETENLEDIKFYLVDNQYDEPVEDKEGYLYLELRYDCAGEEGEGKGYEGYVSFDMAAYREKLTDMDGVLLRLKTDKSGTVTTLVDSKDLFSDSEAE